MMAVAVRFLLHRMDVPPRSTFASSAVLYIELGGLKPKYISTNVDPARDVSAIPNVSVDLNGQ